MGSHARNVSVAQRRGRRHRRKFGPWAYIYIYVFPAFTICRVSTSTDEESVRLEAEPPE